MAKIAIVVIPFWGHINPTISVGQVLIERGHEVSWITSKNLGGLVIPKKGKLYLTNQGNAEEIDRIISIIEDGNSKPAFGGFKHILEEVLIPLNIEMSQELFILIDSIKPDVIINDEQTYIGALCANLKGIPCITSYTAPSGIFESSVEGNVSKWYYNSLRSLQSFLDISGTDDQFRSRELGIVFCPKSFINIDDMMPHQRFVGPCIDVTRCSNIEFDYSAITNNGKKKIMVSIGTLLRGEAERFFCRIVEEFRDSPYNLIVSADPSILKEWPSNFIVKSRLPQSDLIKCVDVVITHGGANTVCDSIGMGIPMVVIPMLADQFYMADQVGLTQTGIRLKYKRLTKGEILKSCEKLLAIDNIYLQNVKKLSVAFRNAGGANAAATLVEEFLTERLTRNS